MKRIDSKELKRLNAAKRIIRENKGTYAPQGAQYDEQGFQYIGTIYYFVKVHPNHVFKKIPAAIGEKMDLPEYAESFFKGMQGDSYATAHVTLKELKEQAAKLKKSADESTLYNPVLRIKGRFFNPAYVVTCMEMLGADNADLEFNEEKRYSPLIVNTEKGVGVIALVRGDGLDANKFKEYVPVSCAARGVK